MNNNLKIFPMKFNCLLIMAVFTFLFSSCDRDMVEDVISITPPELHVIVHSGADKTVRVTGAEVKLYASVADRTAKQNVISTVITNSTGEAIFAEKDFRKGILYVSVTKNATTVVAATPYLLQNDGKTIFWVSM